MSFDEKRDKKARRRHAQEQAVQDRNVNDNQFFWDEQCRHLKTGEFGKKRQPTAREERELFSQVGTFGINFKQYDSIPVKRSGPNAEDIPPLQGFSNLAKWPGFPDFLLNNLVNENRLKWESPTPIQKNAIPLALFGRDLMCCAQTGSGKTAAFLVPLVARIAKNLQVRLHPGPAAPMAIVLCPVRELAAQIALEAKKLAFATGVRAVVVYGGVPFREQLSELAKGAHICIATPGRLTDFVERGLMTLNKCEFLVLDEADRMLDMGFKPQLERIVLQQDMTEKENRQGLMFSATFPVSIQKLAAAFLREGYIWIAVGKVGSTVDSITQKLINAPDNWRQRVDLLIQTINPNHKRSLVFVKRKREAGWICRKLRDVFIRGVEIHGDRTQAQREAALSKFRSGEASVMVATDVAARGLDISGVDHVINYALPPDGIDSYIHRIGRTGRAGHTGLATSFYVSEANAQDDRGDAKLAGDILKLLESHNQEIPSWFRALPEIQGGFHTGKNRSKSRFGGQDMRRGGRNNRGRGRGNSRFNDFARSNNGGNAGTNRRRGGGNSTAGGGGRGLGGGNDSSSALGNVGGVVAQGWGVDAQQSTNNSRFNQPAINGGNMGRFNGGSHQQFHNSNPVHSMAAHLSPAVQQSTHGVRHDNNLFNGFQNPSTPTFSSGDRGFENFGMGNPAATAAALNFGMANLNLNNGFPQTLSANSFQWNSNANLSPLMMPNVAHMMPDSPVISGMVQQQLGGDNNGMSRFGVNPHFGGHGQGLDLNQKLMLDVNGRITSGSNHLNSNKQGFNLQNGNVSMHGIEGDMSNGLQYLNNFGRRGRAATNGSLENGNLMGMKHGDNTNGGEMIKGVHSGNPENWNRGRPHLRKDVVAE